MRAPSPVGYNAFFVVALPTAAAGASAARDEGPGAGAAGMARVRCRCESTDVVTAKYNMVRILGMQLGDGCIYTVADCTFESLYLRLNQLDQLSGHFTLLHIGSQFNGFGAA